MKFLSGFMIGSGLGAAAVNLTIVPHGHNQGFFVGAVFVAVGGILLSVESYRKRG